MGEFTRASDSGLLIILTASVFPTPTLWGIMHLPVLRKTWVTQPVRGRPGLNPHQTDPGPTTLTAVQKPSPPHSPGRMSYCLQAETSPLQALFSRLLIMWPSSEGAEAILGGSLHLSPCSTPALTYHLAEKSSAQLSCQRLSQVLIIRNGAPEAPPQANQGYCG